MTKRLVFFLVFQCFIGICFSQTLVGKVVGVIDGDSFKLLTLDSTVVRVRLANIDCPEKKQPFSAKATKFTADAIFGKTVVINIQKTDRYRRYISNVTYNDSLSLCHELVKHGLAWHYVQYSKDKTLQEMEDKAKAAKVGLWQDPHPIPPWKWRHSKKKKQTTVGSNATVLKSTGAAAVKTSKSVQCTGITRSGVQCKRMTKDESGRCYQHLKT